MEKIISTLVKGYSVFLDYVAKAILGLVFIGAIGLVLAVFIAVPILAIRFAIMFAISVLVIWACMHLNYLD
jgi:hypothetical protein